MLSAHDPIILPEKTEILCFCQGESEFLKYIVFYLSSNELLIYSYSKHSNEIAFEFIPWSKNFKIISMEFSLLHNFLHILTTSNTYIIMPFCMLLEKSKRKQWEDYVLSKKFGNSESYQKQSQNSFLGIFSTLKKYLTKQQTNDENEEELKDPTIFNIKNICFYSINEKKIFNFDDYKNIIAFDENQSTSIEDLSEYYKALSSFCLWKNCLDEEFCIISTLSGGLIFLKLNDGNHYLFYKFPFGIQDIIFVAGTKESYLILNSDIGVYLCAPLEKYKNSSIINLYGTKEYKPFFLNFGNSAKVFSFQINKKTKIFVYQENDGNLLIFNKKNLKTPQAIYYLKTVQLLKIVPWNDYFLILNYENGYKLKLVSKPILQYKKKIQNEQKNNKDLIHEYDINLLKYAEIFSVLDLPDIDLVIDVLINLIQAPSENCNFEVANIEATKRTKYLENILLISNRKISFLNIDFKLMLEKFLQKLKTNFSKEVNLPIYLTYCLYDNFSQDFLCYEIFVKTHYTNYLEIFQNFWNSNKEENRLDILFYLDIYRRTDNKGHIIKMIEDYMSLRNVEVYKCILNYIFKEQSPNAFDKFWIISLLFYSFYFHYFTISFTDFLKNMLELKEKALNILIKPLAQKKVYEEKNESKHLISEKIRQKLFGIFNLSDLFLILHNILFLFETNFRRRMDFKDNTISLILFGRENQFKKQKKFGLIEAEDDNSTFLQNVTLNSFYFEKKKKIIYYIILMIIDPEKDLIKNTVTLILSLNEQEVPFLLYCLLSNYKILYQDVSFINEKSFDSFMNDIHIYDVSNELSSHFCSFFAKVNKESSNKSLICLLKNKESFDAFLIKKLGKQIKSICELKKHWFYEIGGYVISSLVLKYFSLNRKNNNSLLLESILELKKIVKKNHILNIAINLNLFEIIEKI